MPKSEYLDPKKLPANLIAHAVKPGKLMPVGQLAEEVGKKFTLKGRDAAGVVHEWIVKPTGANSFELTVPAGHELGTPAAWTGISVMTQKAVGQVMDCDNQCGCQGNNCGSQAVGMWGEIVLRPEFFLGH